MIIPSHSEIVGHGVKWSPCDLSSFALAGGGHNHRNRLLSWEGVYCRYEVAQLVVEIQHLPVLMNVRTMFTSADIDKQVFKALAIGSSLYDLDEEKLKELQPNVIITKVYKVLGMKKWQGSCFT